MIYMYKQCNYSILLLLYDFEFENVEIKQTWKLELENAALIKRLMKIYSNPPILYDGFMDPRA